MEYRLSEYLNLGVTMQSLLIPHTPQKVLHLKDALAKKKSKVSGNYIMTVKEDGWYAVADFHPELGWSSIHSSPGRAIPAWEAARRKLQSDFNPGKPTRFIWEAIIPDTPFHILNGRFNRKHEEVENVVLILHDMFSLEKGIQGFWKPAKLRVDDCYSLTLPNNMRHATYVGTSDRQDVWENFFEAYVAKGCEGIVLKQENAVYAPGKRMETLLKLKCEIEADLLCTGLTYSFGKKGEPSLNLDLRNAAGNIITVVVPKDNERKAFEADNSLVLGKVVKIRAMKLLESGVYREPTYVCIREDKLPNEID